ncbi:MAG: hypothetical protein MUO51_02610 [Woeseiaceae bacterium]|nr:hypothetical protein [Woeseiaceae bacterium]
MRSEVLASAPGKVVLSGEYAVLDGAPAIAMAVNRRARVTLTSIAGDISEVKAPGYTDDVGRFQNTDGGILWRNGQEYFRIVDSVWRAADVVQNGAKTLNLDTSEFIDACCRRKIGIGSSAALTVALCAAVRQTEDAAATMEMAQRAHADLQGGVGSGVDVACSLSGGLIEYRMAGSAVARLDWPDRLLYRLIWTGVTASTKDRLQKLDAGISRPSRVRLAGASEDMAMAWTSGDARSLLDEYKGYCEHLYQFSIDHHLGIFDAGHNELWRAASAENLVYKPCGAGGGDIGILLGTDEAVLAAFAGKLAANYTILDCKLSSVGVTMNAPEVERL